MKKIQKNNEHLRNLRNKNSALHLTISSIKTEHENILDD